jgi:hypothetical protein
MHQSYIKHTTRHAASCPADAQPLVLKNGSLYTATNVLEDGTTPRRRLGKARPRLVHTVGDSSSNTESFGNLLKLPY